MNYLEVIGLGLNLVGAIILALPILNHKKSFDLEKDRLVNLGETKDEQYRYTTERDKEVAHKAKIGAALVILGFLLQFVANIR